MQSSSPSTTFSAGVSTRTLAAVAAFVFGLMLFLGTGFAWPSVIHNATHDMRHSLGLPCH